MNIQNSKFNFHSSDSWIDSLEIYLSFCNWTLSCTIQVQIVRFRSNFICLHSNRAYNFLHIFSYIFWFFSAIRTVSVSKHPNIYIISIKDVCSLKPFRRLIIAALCVWLFFQFYAIITSFTRTTKTITSTTTERKRHQPKPIKQPVRQRFNNESFSAETIDLFNDFIIKSPRKITNKKNTKRRPKLNSKKAEEVSFHFWNYSHLVEPTFSLF